MKPKYIWEIVFDGKDSEGICIKGKNKYTVVYENKSYFYGKSNGTDELTQFKKDLEDKPCWDDFCDRRLWSTNEAGIEEKVERQMIHNLILSINDSVTSRESLIKRSKCLDRKIDSYNEKILKEQSQLFKCRTKGYLTQ